MLRLTAATLCLSALVSSAQTPSSGSRPAGSDPLSNAKTAAYYERYADELRAKKRLETTRVALRTRKFREALNETGLPAHATVGRFITAGGTRFLAVQVGIPAGAAKPGASLTLFGEVVDHDGRVQFDFEVPSPVLESKGDLYVEHSLLTGDAGAVARVGVAKGEQVLGVASLPLSADSEAREISQLIVSNNVFNLARAQRPFEPFAFGGTKVIPKPDRAFRPADETWLFVELRDPDETAPVPALSFRTAIEGMGKKIAGAWQVAEVLPLKGVAGHFGIGTTVDLSSLQPGEYRVTLSVRDSATKQVFERMQTISVRQ